MLKGFKCVAYSLVLLSVLVINAANVFAAEGGTRAISMGGAFIGLVDDSSAVTWNPAGLAWLENKGVIYSGIVNERDDYVPADFVSDDYVCYTQPLSAGYAHDFKSLGAIGIFFTHVNYRPSEAKIRTYQAGVSYGKEIWENFSVGATAIYNNYDAKLTNTSDTDSTISFNLGMLWDISDNLSLGCVLENANEPTYTLFEVQNKAVRILKPGIAYFFDENTVLTCDIYDLTGNTSDRGSDFSQNIRVGFEHIFSKSFITRLGAHHPNSEVDASKYYSLGLGFQRSDYLAGYPTSYNLDYTLVYWPDATTGMSKYTHQVGIGIKF